MAAGTAAAIAAGIAAVAGVASAEEQKRAAKGAARRSKKAAQAASAAESFRGQREKQKLVARMRMQQAAIEQAGVTSGAQLSSSLFGASQGTTSAAGGAIVASNTLGGYGNLSTAFSNQAARIQNRGAAKAGTYSAIGSIASPFTDPEFNTKAFGME